MKITVNNENAALFAVIQHVKNDLTLDIHEGPGPELRLDNGTVLNTTSSVCRYLARAADQLSLYGSTILQKTEVDHWLEFATSRLSCSNQFEEALGYLNHVLSSVTHIVGHTISLGDCAVWGSLRGSGQFIQLLEQNKVPVNVLRYYKFLSAKPEFVAVDQKMPQIKATPATQDSPKKVKKEEGKFIELPGAEMGKVVVRFPPEASGYLHIGHAKAALLNQYYQETFKGKLIFRFDDTNPAKESSEFEKVILEDVKMLGIKPDIFTHTSDSFGLIMNYCEKLIRGGKAYADNTPGEQMKKEREERIESKNRNNSVEQNLANWEKMKDGSGDGQAWCIRAKLDMSSDNGCLRDPTIYRCKNETHVRTGKKYKVYPTYDFACPIVDSVEGVTHALRTTEYHDRDDQYYWFIDVMGLRKPYVWAYSRLNLQNTVMSKRKLTWFVEQKLVEDWTDPRFPTVRGVMRRGMTLEGLKEFVIAQGSSRSVVMMDWDKIWAFNKKVIDPIVPRYTGLKKENAVEVFVKGVSEEVREAQKHPKNVDVGMKNVWYSGCVMIEGADAEHLKEGEIVTFVNWGNLVVQKIKRNSDNVVTSIDADLNLENTDYKKTQKLTWLAKTEKATFVPTVCVHFGHIISKAIVGKDEDFKDFVNTDSKSEEILIGDPELANLKKGDIIQLQRRGYYICDSPYEPPSRYSGKASPAILFNIPDGRMKEMPKSGSKHKDAANLKEKAQSSKGKAAEKSPQNETAPGGIPGAEDAAFIDQKITDQGNKIRQLKADKVPKSEIEPEVKMLINLKAEYKKIAGKDWKPSASPPASSKNTDKKSESSADLTNINQQITDQGTKIRQLKAQKLSKAELDPEIKVLLSLKAQYKQIAGKDWKPDSGASANAPSAVVTTANTGAADKINQQISDQGAKIRQLKSQKVSKAELDPDIKKLLNLKAQYKDLTGKDWQPESSTPKSGSKMPDVAGAQGTVATDSAEATQLNAKIEAQGTKVREVKAAKADKSVVDAEVKTLLDLKAEYTKLTGVSLTGGAKKNEKSKKGNQKPKQEQQSSKKDQQKQSTDQGASRDIKKVTRLGIEVKKEDNLPEWYHQVITKADMIEYYDVSGCYVFRPWSFGIWEGIQKWFDKEIKDIGFENCYFPMFVSAAALEKEKEHIEDFAPEVAWVTKSGQSELAEPIAVRPTSETVMYPSYSKWVQSHRDLPILLNQWCNVVRWEFKHPQPFLRTREFLWQEGHSAYATYKEAEKEVYHIIDLYEHIYEKMLAIPVVKGKKTQKEKFAGGDFTTTVEAYVSASGRGIQAATSHHLGQNFSKMFDISFEDPETKERQYAYQNSWAITTRSIGIIVMVHGDNKGLVLPPEISTVQVIIVPCGVTASLAEPEKKALTEECENMCKQLKASGVKARNDLRDNYSPGWKFNHWEVKGVPVRVEIGPRDVKQKQFVAVRRDTGEKCTFNLSDSVNSLKDLLKNVQDSMFSKAKKELDESIHLCHTFKEFCGALDKNHLILTPFCGEISCEEKIKKLSARDAVVEEGAPAMGAKGLCIPFVQPTELTQNDKCVCPDCPNKPKDYVLFGRSY